MKQKNTKNLFLVICIFASAFFLAQISHAFLTVNETAEILPENYYQLGVTPQLLLNDGGGFNLGVYADVHIFQDVDGRITFGGGKTDFWTQASMKWVPFPDVDRQPALGGRAAIIYARDEDQDFTGFQITPLISKKADTRYGNMIPYVALPVTFFNSKKNSYTATQFTVGAEWFPESDFHIGGEFNLNLKNSYSSLSAFLSFPFDGSTGYKKRR